MSSKTGKLFVRNAPTHGQLVEKPPPGGELKQLKQEEVERTALSHPLLFPDCRVQASKKLETARIRQYEVEL